MRQSGYFFVCLVIVSFWCAPALALCANTCSWSCENNQDPGTCHSQCMAGCQDQDFSSQGGQSYAPHVPKYGAIAFSSSTFAYGYAYSQPSQDDAELTALEYCKKNKLAPKDCKVQLWFSDACGSLALKAEGKSDDAWGMDWANSKSAAAKKALKICNKSATGGTGCKTEVTICAR